MTAANKYTLPISIYYCLIFMSGGAYGSYIGLYYTDVGFSTLQVGIISSLSALIAIFAQPFWGLLSDRSKYKNHILMLCIVLSTICIWFVPLSQKIFWLVVLFTLLFTVFQCAINPLSDAMTLELAGQYRFKFSNVRTVGSLGFALMSMAAGWIVKYNTGYIFILYTLIMLISLSFTPLIPKVKGHQREGNRMNITVLFRNKQLVCIYIFTFVIQASLGFFFSFHAIYSKEQGISTELIGLGILVGSFSQFPFMIFFDKIYKKFGIINILIFSGLIHAIRWLLCAFIFTPSTILLIWALHGGTFILFYLCLAEYVNTNVVAELKASGQMLNSIFMQGVSKILGSLLGGVSASIIGLKSTFAISSILCFVAVMIFWVVSKRFSLFTAKRQETTTLSSPQAKADLWK